MFFALSFVSVSCLCRVTGDDDDDDDLGVVVDSDYNEVDKQIPLLIGGKWTSLKFILGDMQFLLSTDVDHFHFTSNATRMLVFHCPGLRTFCLCGALAWYPSEHPDDSADNHLKESNKRHGYEHGVWISSFFWIALEDFAALQSWFLGKSVKIMVTMDTTKWWVF